VMALEAADALAETDRARRQARGQRVDQLGHSPRERDEETPTGAARARLRRPAARPPESQDHAALPTLQLEKARHRRPQAQLVGIGGIDAGDQRLGDALDRLASEPPTDE